MRYDAHFGMLPARGFQHVGDRRIKLHGGSFIDDAFDAVTDPIKDAGSWIDDKVNEEIPGGWVTVAAAAAGMYAPEIAAAVGGEATAASGTNFLGSQALGTGAGGMGVGTGATGFGISAGGAGTGVGLSAGAAGASSIAFNPVFGELTGISPQALGSMAEGSFAFNPNVVTAPGFNPNVVTQLGTLNDLQAAGTLTAQQAAQTGNYLLSGSTLTPQAAASFGINPATLQTAGLFSGLSPSQVSAANQFGLSSTGSAALGDGSLQAGLLNTAGQVNAANSALGNLGLSTGGSTPLSGNTLGNALGNGLNNLLSPSNLGNLASQGLGAYAAMSGINDNLDILNQQAAALQSAAGTFGSNLTGAVGGYANNLTGTAGSLGSGLTNAVGGFAGDLTAAGQQAQQDMQFRPVGLTTRFGSTTTPQYDAAGRLTGFGYTVADDIAAQRDRLLSLSNQALPTTTNIGQATTDYYNQLQALQNPQREQDLAAIQARLATSGRSGLGLGATTGANGNALAATNPELAAYYNALAQTQSQQALSAQDVAQQRLNQQIAMSQGLFTNAQALEAAGQQPLALGMQYGGQVNAAQIAGGQAALNAASTASQQQAQAQYQAAALQAQAQQQAASLQAQAQQQSSLQQYLAAQRAAELQAQGLMQQNQVQTLLALGAAQPAGQVAGSVLSPLLQPVGTALGQAGGQLLGSAGSALGGAIGGLFSGSFLG